MATAETSAPLHVALDEQEWRLIRSLREIPTSPLRDRMSELIDTLVEFVADPGCPEMQADGVPCSSAQMSCDRCHEVIALLEELRQRVRHG